MNGDTGNEALHRGIEKMYDVQTTSVLKRFLVKRNEKGRG
jgi:hypothetical protein